MMEEEDDEGMKKGKMGFSEMQEESLFQLFHTQRNLLKFFDSVFSHPLITVCTLYQQ